MSCTAWLQAEFPAEGASTATDLVDVAWPAGREPTQYEPAQYTVRRTTMATPNAFHIVESIGRTLPGVEVSTSWGQPSLKLRGQMVVCMASHPSAESDTLVVMMDMADRDMLVQEEPLTYYLKPHYLDHPCVLVRLRQVGDVALRDLIIGACRFVSATTTHTKIARGKTRKTAGPRGAVAGRTRHSGPRR